MGDGVLQPHLEQHPSWNWNTRAFLDFGSSPTSGLAWNPGWGGDGGCCLLSVCVSQAICQSLGIGPLSWLSSDTGGVTPVLPVRKLELKEVRGPCNIVYREKEANGWSEFLGLVCHLMCDSPWGLTSEEVIWLRVHLVMWRGAHHPSCLLQHV